MVFEYDKAALHQPLGLPTAVGIPLVSLSEERSNLPVIIVNKQTAGEDQTC